MTDSIGINNDIKTITRYSLGYTLEEKEYSIDPSSLVWTIGLEKGFRGANTLFPYAKNAKSVWNQQKALEESLKGATRKETITNYKRAMEIQNTQRRLLECEIREIEKSNLSAQQKKGLIDLKKSTHYNRIKQEIDSLKQLDPKAYTQKMKEIEQKIADLNLKNATQKLTNIPTSKMGKAWYNVKKHSGYLKANKKVAELVSKSSKLQKVAKFGRMNALSAVGIDLAFGIPEIIETKKELGTGKAIKQTGRVLAIAGTQVAAYAAGAKAGAAMGAAIGSVIPGAGTLVGSILGAAVGLTASYFTGKVAQKIFGKSELDQAHDQIANEISAQASENPELLNEIMYKTAEKYESDQEDPEIVAQAYNNIATALINESEISEENTKSTTENSDEMANNSSNTENTNATSTVNSELKETIAKLDYIINSFENTSYTNFSNEFNVNNNNFNFYNPFNTLYNPYGMQNFNLNNLQMFA